MSQLFVRPGGKASGGALEQPPPERVGMGRGA